MVKKFFPVLFLILAFAFVSSKLVAAQTTTTSVNVFTGATTTTGAVSPDIAKSDVGNAAPDPNLFKTVRNVTGGLGASVSDIILDKPAPVGSGTHADSSIGSVGTMIGMLYTPPATANEYVADLIHDAGIATPAYAQGLGFSSLAPVLETWKVFRTVAYFFYVIIFLVIGFMIMFRQKIGSQTVVTVQQALPKLLVSLIAVTFSYAIAGLLIEVMYISMFLILNVFVAGTLGGISIPGNGPGGQINLQSFGSNSNIFSIAGIIINGGTLNNASQAVGTMVTGALGISTTDQAANSIVGTISGLAAVVVFAIALLFSIFRLFFELLKTYITIIIMIVTAPIALMLGALPGNNAFANWIKGLVFNLAVFPTVLVVIVMAYLLQSSISANGGFLPPYIGGTGTSGAIAPILGLGVLLVLPDIVEKVKKMAPAGPFDDLANKAQSALSKGFTGGQLVPGLGFTDTRKLPGGGLSGENIFRKTGIGAAGGIGGVVGAVEGELANRRGDRTKTAWSQAGARLNLTARDLGTKLGDKQINNTPAKKEGGH